MKKLFALLLAAALVFCLAACDNILFLNKDKDSQTETTVPPLPDGTLESTLETIEKDFEKTTKLLTDELTAAMEAIGDTYDGSDAQKKELADWYALAESESKGLYERTVTKSEDYYKLVAGTVDNKDTAALDEAMSDYYNRIHDTALAGYQDDVHALFQQIWKEYSTDGDDTVSDAFHQEWDDAGFAVDSLYLDAEKEIKKDWDAVNKAFSEGKFNIYEILNLK